MEGEHISGKWPDEWREEGHRVHRRISRGRDKRDIARHVSLRGKRKRVKSVRKRRKCPVRLYDASSSERPGVQLWGTMRCVIVVFEATESVPEHRSAL